MGKNKIEPAMVEKQWKPGSSPNPSGKPKGTRNSATILRELLALESDQVNPKTGHKFTEHELLMARWIQSGKGFKRPDGKYANPNYKAIESIVDRVDGKVSQDFKVGEDPNNPISSNITKSIADQLKKFVEEESRE